MLVVELPDQFAGGIAIFLHSYAGLFPCLMSAPGALILAFGAGDILCGQCREIVLFHQAYTLWALRQGKYLIDRVDRVMTIEGAGRHPAKELEHMFLLLCHLHH